MSRRGSAALPAATLIGVTATWGSTFFLIKILLEQMTVLDFLSIRFAIASVALVALAPRALGRLQRPDVRHGVVLGLLYGVAQVLQTLGLNRTPASVSGFVTGMYVVMTPLFAAAVFAERVSATVWLGVSFATIGLGFLSLHGFAVSAGVILIFGSAALYALHILGLGRWSRPENFAGLSIIQMGVICLVCTIASAPNGIHPPSDSSGWWSLLYMAIVAGALALLGQTWAQAHLPATRAAIIMTMEPVWAAFFAVLFGGEVVTSRMIVGGSFVLAAMYVVELAPRRHVESEMTHLGA